MRKVAAGGSRFVLEARLASMRKFIRIIVLYSVLNPLLYLLAIGVGVGTLINQNSGGIDGVDYLVFLAPALLANAAIQGSMDETIFPTLGGFLWEKTFFGMNATPLGGRAIALGVYWAAMVRNIFTVVCYYLVMMAFGVLKAPHAWLALPAGILAGAAFGAVMLAFAGNVKNEDHFFTFVGRFIIQPMFFLSGTFFPLESIPIFLRWIGWISPLWHATDLGRYLTYGRDIPITLVWVHVIFLVTMIVVGLKLAFIAFEKRLAK
ncbi:MAG: ABC transporter permease [Candidatus Nanopelagicaceae bacterium]|jgi:lipooligosaccharide transport system permease protein